MHLNCVKKLRKTVGISYGIYTCVTRLPKVLIVCCEPVGVIVVTKIDLFCANNASISGVAAIISPSETVCIHMSTAVYACLYKPKRSPIL